MNAIWPNTFFTLFCKSTAKENRNFQCFHLWTLRNPWLPHLLSMQILWCSRWMSICSGLTFLLSQTSVLGIHLKDINNRRLIVYILRHYSQAISYFLIFLFCRKFYHRHLRGFIKTGRGIHSSCRICLLSFFCLTVYRS